MEAQNTAIVNRTSACVNAWISILRQKFHHSEVLDLPTAMMNTDSLSYEHCMYAAYPGMTAEFY